MARVLREIAQKCCCGQRSGGFDEKKLGFLRRFLPPGPSDTTFSVEFMVFDNEKQTTSKNRKASLTWGFAEKSSKKHPEKKSEKQRYRRF